MGSCTARAGEASEVPRDVISHPSLPPFTCTASSPLTSILASAILGFAGWMVAWHVCPLPARNLCPFCIATTQELRLGTL
jgi:hypothetical protein